MFKKIHREQVSSTTQARTGWGCTAHWCIALTDAPPDPRLGEGQRTRGGKNRPELLRRLIQNLGYFFLLWKIIIFICVQHREFRVTAIISEKWNVHSFLSVEQKRLIPIAVSTLDMSQISFYLTSTCVFKILEDINIWLQKSLKIKI